MAGLARHWVVDLLCQNNRVSLAERAELCTSELVTNAHLHTASPVITVEASLSSDGVTVCVHDGDPGCAPQPRDAWASADLFGTTGRGLGLVAAYADQWAAVADETSKTVWFLLVDGPAAPCAT
ncbi:ATP-binding protein [Streptomyces sp. bgisy100]|uniref:ATP-binding protein n=1 Tax=Streptomyces sp. bgisy100 TaxID=3413783 RepID=UPI003D765B75